MGNNRLSISKKYAYLIYFILVAILLIPAFMIRERSLYIGSKAQIFSDEDKLSVIKATSRGSIVNEERGVVFLQDKGEKTNWIGAGSDPLNSHTGFLFTLKGSIPQDAEIILARLELVSSQVQQIPVEIVIYGDSSFFPQPFSQDSPPSKRLLTVGSQSISLQTQWLKDTPYSFDVTKVVQEVFQSGSSKDAIAFIIRGGINAQTGKMFFYNKNVPDKTPKLLLYYK